MFVPALFRCFFFVTLGGIFKVVWWGISLVQASRLFYLFAISIFSSILLLQQGINNKAIVDHHIIKKKHCSYSFL